MVCQTAKSIEDVLRVALRITSEDEVTGMLFVNYGGVYEF